MKLYIVADRPTVSGWELFKKVCSELIEHRRALPLLLCCQRLADRSQVFVPAGQARCNCFITMLIAFDTFILVWIQWLLQEGWTVVCLSVLCWWVNRYMGLQLGQAVIMPPPLSSISVPGTFENWNIMLEFWQFLLMCWSIMVYKVELCVPCINISMGNG